MFKPFSIFSALIFFAYCCSAQLPPIGQWRDHLPYHQAMGLATAGDKIYCATPYAVFSLNPADNSIERYSKINGLHEAGVSAIQWDAQTNSLVVAYNSSSIDILSGQKISNIEAVKNSNITGDKKIYSIFCYAGLAYLCSGLGIIVIDESRNEVKDTYIIGAGGNKVKVNGLTTDGTFFYAATAEGIRRSPLSNTNLADYHNWQLMSGGLLDSGACANVLNLQGSIIAQKGDSVFSNGGSSWRLLYASNWHITFTAVSANSLVICQQKADSARVLVLDGNGAIARSVRDDMLLAPRAAMLLNNSIWVADSVSCLIGFGGARALQFQPNSPLSVATGTMAAANGALWVASGGLKAGGANSFNRNGLYRFKDGEWANYNSPVIKGMDSLYDLLPVAIDARDNSLWAGSFGGGLLQFKPGNTLNVFKQGTALEPSQANASRYNISGLAFDRNNNLWVSDYGAGNNLVVKKREGNWYKFSAPFPLTGNAAAQVLTDDNDQQWIVSPGNGLLCFNHGQTIENPADDKWKWYRAGAGRGGLPDNNVNCIAKDKNGFIWVGTANGVGIVQCPQQVFSGQGCEAVLPVVQQDNFAGYLFRGESVQCIAVDGADRKWVGTKNGVWLISPDGDKTIYRFTAENSPLPDNDVNAIAIDGITGEVFFSTASGICSFRSTATTGGSTNSDVLVFPNPVPPGYNGTIAIRGLVDNATVKITELNGRLVYQTRALGGQATWNGRDYKGGTVATGVYLVWITDDAKQEKAVTKIVFISK